MYKKRRKFLPEVPRFMQSIPNAALYSAICRALISAKELTGDIPEFSASDMGIDSSASENARNAYCSKVLILSAAAAQAKAQEISAAPPP